MTGKYFHVQIQDYMFLLLTLLVSIELRISSGIVNKIANTKEFAVTK
jgi:hypothetical protein